MRPTAVFVVIKTDFLAGQGIVPLTFGQFRGVFTNHQAASEYADREEKRTGLHHEVLLQRLNEGLV